MLFTWFSSTFYCFSLLLLFINYYCFSFPCGRWLGRGVDDDSSERLLIGKRISENSERGRNVTATRIRSPSVPPMRSCVADSEIQQHLGAYTYTCILHFCLIKLKHHFSKGELSTQFLIIQWKEKQNLSNPGCCKNKWSLRQYFNISVNILRQKIFQ